MVEQAADLTEYAFELAYYTRGSCPYPDILHISVPEKDVIFHFIKDRLSFELAKPRNDVPVY